jgi:hypothetical protein
MSAAAIGFVGVLVGSLITGSWQFGLAYREERSQRRAASRLVAAELRGLYQQLWIPAAVVPALDLLNKLPDEQPAWDTYNGLLGAALAAPDWFAVANAYESLRGLDGIRAVDFARMPDEDSRENVRQAVRITAANVRAGIDALEKIEPNVNRPRLLDLPDLEPLSHS